jgi:hypothetical protein
MRILVIVTICRFVQYWKGLVKDAAGHPLLDVLLPLNKASAG